MQIKNQLLDLCVLVLTAVAFTLAGCESQYPVSQNSDTQDADQFAVSDVSTEPVLDDAPLSEEEVNAITAPEDGLKHSRLSYKASKYPT